MLQNLLKNFLRATRQQIPLQVFMVFYMGIKMYMLGMYVCGSVNFLFKIHCLQSALKPK